jgi:hypothetical protein
VLCDKGILHLGAGTRRRLCTSDGGGVRREHRVESFLGFKAEHIALGYSLEAD